MYDGQGHGLLVHILLRVAKVRGFIREKHKYSSSTFIYYVYNYITTTDTDQAMVWPTFEKLMQPSPLAFYYYCYFLYIFRGLRFSSSTQCFKNGKKYYIIHEREPAILAPLHGIRKKIG